ncbi:Lipoteichoic acid synthase [Bienertia sinuspersici]
MNEAAEHKNGAISANEQNKILTKKLKDVERENKDFEESDKEYGNEENKDGEEISGNDQRHK